MDLAKQPSLRINQIFLLQSHFAHREDVLTLPHNYQVGELNLDVEVKVGTNPQNSAGIVTVTVKTRDEDKPAYLFAVEMAAVVEREGDGNLPPNEYLRTNGAATLYPFVRELVASLTWRGRFGPIWLKPINVTVPAETVTAITAESGARAPDENKTSKS
jgi:preprotein translocase subunit SecB